MIKVSSVLYKVNLRKFEDLITSAKLQKEVLNLGVLHRYYGLL